MSCRGAARCIIGGDIPTANETLPDVIQDGSITWLLWSTKSIGITPGADYHPYKKAPLQRTPPISLGVHPFQNENEVHNLPNKLLLNRGTSFAAVHQNSKYNIDLSQSNSFKNDVFTVKTFLLACDLISRSFATIRQGRKYPHIPPHSYRRY